MTNCRWQTVPRDWPGYRESSVAKFRPRTWNRVVGAGRRVEPIACRIIVAVGVYRIGLACDNVKAWRGMADDWCLML